MPVNIYNYVRIFIFMNVLQGKTFFNKTTAFTITKKSVYGDNNISEE